MWRQITTYLGCGETRWLKTFTDFANVRYSLVEFKFKASRFFFFFLFLLLVPVMKMVYVMCVSQHSFWLWTLSREFSVPNLRDPFVETEAAKSRWNCVEEPEWRMWSRESVFLGEVYHTCTEILISNCSPYLYILVVHRTCRFMNKLKSRMKTHFSFFLTHSFL
jgi:hypothetical protein